MHQGLWKYLGMNSRLMLQSQSPNGNVSRVGIIKDEGNLETVGMSFNLLWIQNTVPIQKEFKFPSC